MVTRVDVPVVLQGQCLAACLVEDTHCCGQADPRIQRFLEHVNMHFADVAPHPLIKDTCEEHTPLLRLDRAIGNRVAFLTQGAPVRVNALHDWNELYPSRSEFVSEKAIHLKWMVAVGCVDRAENIEVDFAIL